MGTLANSEDPDEMPYNMAFHLGLHCLLRVNNLRERDSILEIITCNPQIYIMNHPKLIVSYLVEELIRIQKVKLSCTAFQWARCLFFWSDPASSMWSARDWKALLRTKIPCTSLEVIKLFSCSTEHEISTAQKTKILTNEEASCFKPLRCCIYHAYKC